MKFSVLMSVYNKENPEYLKQSLESILINQTVLPSEVILVEDGPLNQDLYDVLKEFKDQFYFFKTVRLEKNLGLGLALNEGLKYCNYEWVARMDSDDIARSDRFQEQIHYLKKNPTLDIIGSNIVEFKNSMEEVVSEKTMPLTSYDIIKYSKRRNPFNHMTVMFKKSSVEKAGGYQSLPYVEDYYLWVRMIVAGARLSNIDKTLVYVRVGNGMYERRSNKRQIKSLYILNNYMKSNKLITMNDYLINILAMVFFVFLPIKIKKFLYLRFLRNR